MLKYFLNLALNYGLPQYVDNTKQENLIGLNHATNKLNTSKNALSNTMDV